jgi:ABC-type transport system involved in multi-copper enzyme maturation permease subunit
MKAMNKLLNAELQKIIGHRWVTGLLIWIFPVGALAASLLLILASLLSPMSLRYFGLGNIKWTDQMLGVWNIPIGALGRLLLIGFMAFVFAGEYQWDTWKNILPYNSRPRIILTKYLAVGLLILISFATMSVIWSVGPGIAVKFAGVSYGPVLTDAIVADFAGDYIFKTLLTFTVIMISAGYAALGGVITRSVLGSALVGFGAILLEELSIGILLVMSTLLNKPGVLNLYRLTPTYNLYNVSSWMNSNTPYRLQIPGFEHLASDSMSFSAVVLVLWVFALVALTMMVFQRQDIT